MTEMTKCQLSPVSTTVPQSTNISTVVLALRLPLDLDFRVKKTRLSLIVLFVKSNKLYRASKNTGTPFDIFLMH